MFIKTTFYVGWQDKQCLDTRCKTASQPYIDMISYQQENSGLDIPTLMHLFLLR